MTSAGRILVVDDDPLVRRSLARVLVRRGYTVLEATDGRAAAERVEEGNVDVVLSDIAMPDMDGMALLERVRQSDRDLPVLLLTGNPELETAMKAVEYGAFQYLKKPVDVETLLRSVGRAAEARRIGRERAGALTPARVADTSTPMLRRTWTGAELAGRYRVGQMIGEGGMGTVYEAVREDLAKMRVAIKILHPVLLARGDLLARFRREAEIVAAIDHPNIVRVLDFHSPPGGPAFLVMERLQGTTLGAVLEQQRRIPIERAVFIASQVLSALDAAHKLNVVHRDLKPDNVFLTSMSGLRDIVKLLDFGIAKLTGPTDEQKLTATGLVLGTPPYMAPEYARTGRFDSRADVYAAGCLLYEMLAGRQPHAGDNYNALMFAIQTQEPVPISALCAGLPPAIAEIIEKAMTKDPEQRFASAAEMGALLEPWVVPVSSVGHDPVEPQTLGTAPTQLVPTPDHSSESKRGKPPVQEGACARGKLVSLDIMEANDKVDLSEACEHVLDDMPRHVKRPTAGCKECLEIGGRWVHLRICLTCGHVGCCDNSPNRHATKHFNTTRHPVITSGEPGETWAYCYEDDAFLSRSV